MNRYSGEPAPWARDGDLEAMKIDQVPQGGRRSMAQDAA
jgi:hypothetical protein